MTKEKLQECAHEFDSNINESLNNIVSKYAPKRKHFSKFLSLVTRVYIAAGVYLVRFHYLWTLIYAKLNLKIPINLEMCWINKDSTKIKKYGKEHTIEYKRKRKSRENANLAREVKHRENDIKRNYEYGPSIGITPTLIKKTKTFKNNCEFKCYGCDGKSNHKSNKSKHCRYYKLDGAALEAAKAAFINTLKDT